MKKTKNAFTIAELLLVIAIIGVITAMGANITKKSTAKAYNLYWHTGYTTLNDAIAEVEYNNSEIVSVSPATKIPKYQGFNDATWKKELEKVINGVNEVNPNEALIKEDDEEYASDINKNYEIRTRNGIRYIVGKTGGGAGVYITMEVPAPKTRTNNGRAKTNLLFHKSKNLLIPINGGDVDLSKRMDLLPVIIDDGFSGRVLKKYSDKNGNDAKYYRSNVYSFQEAYCRNDGSNLNIDLYFNCKDENGQSLVPEKREPGILTFPSPKH